MDMIDIPLDQIDEDTGQPRYQFDEEALKELAASIEELGLLSPIKVRPVAGGRYQIIYGNRRYKASKMLGRKTIPCIVSDLTDEKDIYLEQIAENLTREGFSPIEEAEAFDKMMNDPKFRMSMTFLAGKLGKPESYIRNKCELLKFGNAVKKLIVGGTEIRKDKLTEEQLLPLKDLPIEHRDPLALIAARDELPVSDVKKIAKLFKDKTISAATKDKLLLKTGSGLIETWSVYEQNRKEKAKAAAQAAEKAESQAAAAVATADSQAAATAGPVDAAKGDSRATATVESEALATGASQQASGEGSASEQAERRAEGDNTSGAGSALRPESAERMPEGELERMLAALPAEDWLTPETLAAVQTMPEADVSAFLLQSARLIDRLERLADDWRRLAERADASAHRSAAQ